MKNATLGYNQGSMNLHPLHRYITDSIRLSQWETISKDPSVTQVIDVSGKYHSFHTKFQTDALRHIRYTYVRFDVTRYDKTYLTQHPHIPTAEIKYDL